MQLVGTIERDNNRENTMALLERAAEALSSLIAEARTIGDTKTLIILIEALTVIEQRILHPNRQSNQ